ncbi:MAG: hypothetical protein ACR2GY_07070 [Phycisphaerales bacterium]
MMPCICIIVAVACGGLSPNACSTTIGADDSDRSSGITLLDVYVDERTFRQILERFGFDETQVVLAQPIFEQYWADILVLDVEAKQAVDEAGWLEFAQLSRDARERRLGHDEFPFEELADLQQRFHWARAQKLGKSDDRLEKFGRDIVALSRNSEQAEEVKVALVPMVRRDSYFRRYAGNRQLGDFNAYVDVELALSEFGDAQGRMGRDIDPDVHAPLRDAIVRYGRRFEQAVEPHFDQARRRLPPDFQASSAPDSEQEKTRLARARRVRETGLDAADAIERVLREYSTDETADAWRLFFRQRLCPELYADRAVEVWYPWAMSTYEFDEARRGLIERWHALYLQQRDRLREEAFRIGLRVENEFGRQAGSSDLQKEYQKLLVELREPAANFTSRFTSLLAKEEREVFDARMQRFSREPGARNFNSGPPVYQLHPLSDGDSRQRKGIQ